MLSNGFETPLHLKLKPSRTLFNIRVVAHMLALMAISLPLSIPFAFKLALYIFVLVSLMLTVKHRLKTKDSTRVFRWRETHHWIESKSASASASDMVWRCQRGAIITPWFIIVKLQLGSNRQSLFIDAEQCTKQLYRRLSVRLKYLSSPTQEAQEVVASTMDSR